MSQVEPSCHCTLCPRLAEYREQNRSHHPDWFNRPVPSFGCEKARLLIVGLAPGLQGANRTGRPFTGDWAGDLLYATLLKYGFACGTYRADPDDGLTLIDCMIINAVRCVPPQNKPVGAEIKNCQRFLKAGIEALENLQTILALGRIAHDSTLTALGKKKRDFPFSHGAKHRLNGELQLIDSYHCSRYNTNTRRLTEPMFHHVFEEIRAVL